MSKKLARPAPAKEFYCSEWFRKARDYVEATGCAWFILSAKYGLVAPHTVLHPYNRTLNKMLVEERRAWASRVLSQLDTSVHALDQIIFLAGERYREFLVDELQNRKIKVAVPMAGLGIGKQLAWLKQHSSASAIYHRAR